MDVYTECLCLYSSSKDQLTGMNVAIKKIMKPFSAPVLAKRTYRELKLLKALRHENVWIYERYGRHCRCGLLYHLK